MPVRLVRAFTVPPNTQQHPRPPGVTVAFPADMAQMVVMIVACMGVSAAPMLP